MFKEGNLDVFNYDTKLLGVLGENIIYTLSPYIHNYVFRKEGINAVYLAFDIKKEKFDKIFPALLDITYGLNVTIPYKEIVIDYLDALDESASLIGAVNTIMNKKGYNTDYIALVNLIRNKLPIKVKSCVIFGAGGAAKASAFALANLGCNEVYLANRSYDRALKLVEHLKEKTGVRGEVIKSCEILKEIDVLVNATPNPDFITDDCIMKANSVVEFIYKPVETSLIKRARKRTNLIINGIEILVLQALEAEKLWFNVSIDYNDVVSFLYARELIR